MRLHDLRHSAVKVLVAEGMHSKVVGELLGHSQLAVSMDLCNHVAPMTDQQARSVMAR
jgi:site-specific recombinase XerD